MGKHRIIPFYLPSQSSGNEQIIDVTGSDRTAKFSILGIPARASGGGGQNGDYAYIDSIDFYVRTQADVGVGGAIIAQELARLISTVEIRSDVLGGLYKPNDIKGPVLYNVASVISNGYALPHALGADLAASAVNQVRNLRVRVPIAHKCLHRGHQTALPVSVLHGASVEVTLAESTVLADVEAGSAFEATTAVVCVANVFFASDPYMPAPWVWREYETQGGQTHHIIKGLGMGAGLGNAAQLPQKVAFLGWLSNTLGLGGASTVDQIQQIASEDLGIPNLAIGSPHYAPAPFLYNLQGDVPTVGGWEETALGNGWPYKPGADLTASPSDANAMVMPYFWPDPDGQEVSVLPGFGRDVSITHQYGATPSAAARFLALEQAVLSEEQEEIMRERMGVPEGYVAVPKTAREGAGPDDDATPEMLLNHELKRQGIAAKFRPASRVDGE